MKRSHPVIQKILDAFDWRLVQPTLPDDYLACHGRDEEGFRLNGFLDRNFFELVSGWSDNYKATWLSDELWTIASWCEGDINLYVTPSEASYKSLVAECHQAKYKFSSGHIDFDSNLERSPIAQAAINSIPGVEEQTWRKVRLYQGGKLGDNIIWQGDSIPDAIDFAEREWEAMPDYERKSVEWAPPDGSGGWFSYSAVDAMRRHYPRTEES